MSKITKYLWVNKIYASPRARGRMMGNLLFERMCKYVGSPEFRYSKRYADMELPDSYVSRNAIVLLHIWLINERLLRISYGILDEMKKVTLSQRLFDKDLRRQYKNSHKVLNVVNFLNDRMRESYKLQTEKWLYRIKIHATQRARVKKIIEKHAEQSSYMLYSHFIKKGKVEEDLTALIHTIFFPQKLNHRPYPAFVYQITEYLLKQREYLDTLDLEDFLIANIHWDVYRVDRDKVAYNIHKEEGAYNPEDNVSLSQDDLKVLEDLEAALPEGDQSNPEEEVKAPKTKRSEKFNS
jgi:uncharacterized protein YqfB (UPF0267 family)